ncbi:SSI family serine proteinase inhibitor [Micromonospora sp. KC723]|uniref:SSI family serine proteinase inhibitor n=1 Tax=Micromonospora sp. KC723 TaxID=2530381 RepID=UPI001043663F|nr:SSI family serine proteinase inhibitor [Micromonospora sp. KC723]TDB74973.1 proteinase inhibitor I4 serpin [Micromonospora sp. KC723]
MPFTRRATAAALTITGLAAALLPATAQAAPRSGPQTPSVLLLSTEQPGDHRSAVLVCEPAGGTHPDAADACHAVAHVNGDLSALAFDEGPCTFEYAPVTAHAWGFWQDRPVAWSKTYSNRCLLLRGTRALFDF